MYIAALELKKNALDVVIRRPLPSNKFYEINLKDLRLPNDIDTVIAMYEDM